MSERFVEAIDFYETNWGLGDHRTWSRLDREAWHKMSVKEGDIGPGPIEECDCHALGLTPPTE